MTDLDALIGAQLARGADATDDADWDDVLARARRAGRRRVLAVALVVAVAIAGAATALALEHPIVDFGTAGHAPRHVVVEFGRMDVVAPPLAGPHVLPHESRRITAVTFSNGKRHTLYVAPTRDGGFCEQWSGGFGGCRRERDSDRLEVTSTVGRVGARELGGSFFQRTGDRLEVRYADGDADVIPFVRVSKPIDASFYLFEVPAAHRRKGHEAASVALYDADGKLLDRQPVPRGEPPDRVVHVQGFAPILIPHDAVYARRRILFDLRTNRGVRFGLWVAPSRLGGRCYWWNRGSGCDRGRRLELPPLAGLGLSGGAVVTLCCDAGRGVTGVELRFQDGDRIRLGVREGLLVALLPARHYARGKRLSRLVGYDRDGRAIASRKIDPSSPGIYPCRKPKKLPYGVKICP